ncbi:hypothetical protein CPLU01_01369 [Colletotrichum plurivorum]|uniref:Uncharacterized protein n=1 Tax=Colletotrichum plurivorum TaxID=2175906 RepID=A0A8H6NPD4_9PEZI|nr:hypothetical protein CPLU01_01369 [Colletotrichum plurivorum]
MALLRDGPTRRHIAPPLAEADTDPAGTGSKSTEDVEFDTKRDLQELVGWLLGQSPTSGGFAPTVRQTREGRMAAPSPDWQLVGMRRLHHAIIEGFRRLLRNAGPVEMILLEFSSS